MASRARSRGMAPLPQALVHQHRARSRIPTDMQALAANVLMALAERLVGMPTSTRDPANLLRVALPIPTGKEDGSADVPMASRAKSHGMARMQWVPARLRHAGSRTPINSRGFSADATCSQTTIS